jgi:MYXO-CTERM domain-containing protein
MVAPPCVSRANTSSVVRAVCIGLTLVCLGGPGPALAHPSGMPAVAWPLLPRGVGTVVDDAYRFHWTDANYITLTGTITIDWFATRAMPPTFQLGVTPPDLEGAPIVLGVPEADRTDAYTWRTSTVAAGSYWVWSRVNDLPTEIGSIRINAFSPGVVTIAHPGDPIHPAANLPRPTTAFDIAEVDYDVVVELFDPDGTARYSLWAMQSRDGSDRRLLVDDVAVGGGVRTSTFTWTVTDVPEGDWFFQVHIEDARGLSFDAYPRFLLRVQRPFFVDAGPGADAPTGPAADASADASAARDASVDGDAARVDVGLVRQDELGTRCGCSAAGEGAPLGSAAWGALGALLAWASRRPRGRR